MALQPQAPPSAGAPSSEPAPRHGSVKGAAFWTLGGEAATHAIRLLSSLALTRLLFPDAFGIMAVVNVFLFGLEMCSDLGIRTIIIRHERGDDPAFLDTMWSVRLVRGALLGVADCLIAWPLSRLYGLPQLAWLLPAASLNLVLEGFQSTKVYYCHRHMLLQRATLITLGTSLFGVAVMIAGAAVYPSVWVLVWGAVAGTLARVVLSHTSLPGPANHFSWDRSAWREVSHFGKWVFVSSMATFLAEQMDRLLFAKFMPLALLGVYALAISITKLPAQVALRLASSLILPALSRVRNAPAEMNRVFNRLRLRILLAGGFGISFLILCGPSLVSVMYDHRYAEAGWILQVSCIGAWFVILGASQSPALMVQGHPQWQALAMGVKAAVMVLAIPWAFAYYGFPGAMVAFGIAESVRYLFESAKVRQSGLRDWGADAGSTVLMVVCGVAAAAIRFGPTRASAGLKAALSFAVFATVWTGVAAWYFRRKSGAE